MYNDYYNYGYNSYDPPTQYYEPEPVYYEPEPMYYDTDPVCENEVYYDNHDFDNAAEADVYEDIGEGFSADVPSYNEEIMEEFCEDPEVLGDFGEKEQWDSTRYELNGYLEDVDNAEPPHTPEIIGTPYSIDLAHATEAEIDAASWAAVYTQGPPPGESSNTWYDAMDAWHLRIATGCNQEPVVSGDDDVDVLEAAAPPAYVPWMAEQLAEMQGTLDRGEIPEDERELWEQDLAELWADELEDQRLQALGYVWDEGRGDYWHPVHGWGADDEGSDPVDAAPLPSQLTDVFESAEDVDMPPHLPHATLDLYEPIHLVISPTYTVPPRSTHRKHSPRRYAIPRAIYVPRERLHPSKHPTNRQNGYRSASARPTARNRRPTGRRTRSCPDLQQEPPPHLATALAPATDHKKRPDTPTMTGTRTAVANNVANNAPAPEEPIQPDIASSITPNTPSPAKSNAWLPTIAAVHTTALPVPPDKPRTRPSTTLAAERRRNAQRRLAKKGKS
ncbi:hypothetical protein MVEN_00488300 [Mycena venus]|uniref:Uncharacterized protein n=1 Tax=Mycena venus TaxID=2733690 RepID=A0A8H7D9B9_9AGAR|nr:hypothetical protein MVEN_00488300 [Mycena venus]